MDPIRVLLWLVLIPVTLVYLVLLLVVFVVATPIILLIAPFGWEDYWSNVGRYYGCVAEAFPAGMAGIEVDLF